MVRRPWLFLIACALIGLAFGASSVGAAFINAMRLLDGSGNSITSTSSALDINIKSGGLAANQSVNVAQYGGTNISTGTGAGGTGIPRVTVSNDSSLAANQSVNVAQMNGVTTTMNNGVAGTGVQRVALASDNTAIAAWGLGATGSAVPSGAHYMGGNGSGNLTGIIACDNWTAISQTANTQVITGVSAKKTYICSVNLVTATAQNVAIIGGTGTTCATSPHAIAGGTTAATGWNFAANGGLTIGSGLGVVMQAATSADNICIFQSGSGQLSGTVAWTQF